MTTKRHWGRLIGDIFFFCFMFVSVASFMAIVLTPARGFVWNELLKLGDLRGEVGGPLRFQEKLKKLGLEPDEIKPSILVRKRSRELILLSENLVIATYPVGIGVNPIGIKLNGTDGKTPEGQYYLARKEARHRFHLFLQLNYPAPDDARRGSVQQILKPGQEEMIINAWDRNQVPPTDTPLGGPLGIHGFGAESNWTGDGSIAMHNAHLEEIFWILATGTPVAIVP